MQWPFFYQNHINMPEVKLLKTLMGSFSGAKGSIIDVPQYVAKVYVNAGLAERVKPCDCDDCKDGEPCPETETAIEEAVAQPEQTEVADAAPKRKRRTRKK